MKKQLKNIKVKRERRKYIVNGPNLLQELKLWLRTGPNFVHGMFCVFCFFYTLEKG